MKGTNGHSISGVHQRLFELAIRAGVRPSWEAIAQAAGVTGQTLRRAFYRAGGTPTRPTLECIAEALETNAGELQRLHAMLQLEAPIELHPPSASAKTEPAPPPEPEPDPDPTPRNFMSELCDYCLQCVPVVVATHDPNVGTTMVCGRVVNIYNGWVAVFSPGDKRASRVRIENITDVRRAPAID